MVSSGVEVLIFGNHGECFRAKLDASQTRIVTNMFWRGGASAERRKLKFHFDLGKIPA
jgi:hypothetical protein